MDEVKRGIAGVVHEYANSMDPDNPGGCLYSFAITLTGNIEIVGKGYKSYEERACAIVDICAELEIIPTDKESLR